MRILDASGKPADARLLATLYDASLDRLWENPWNFYLTFRRYTPSVMPFIQRMNSVAMAYSPFYTYSLSSVYVPDNWQLYSRLWIPSLQLYQSLTRNVQMIRGTGIMMKAAAAAPNVMMKEDASTVRKDNAPENLSLLKKIVLNLLRMDATNRVKSSLRLKRKRAAWDDELRMRFLGLTPL